MNKWQFLPLRVRSRPGHHGPSHDADACTVAIGGSMNRFAAAVPPKLWKRLPILDWGRSYTRLQLASDLTAAVIVTIMLIPQSLAYAMLAGMPPVTGLYASILPLVAYTLFGTSRSLAVGPVAVISLMTASAVGEVASQGTAGYAVAASLLAFMSGVILILLGAVRFGALASFLSHPVISGFITASGLIIAVGQLPHLLGVKAHGETVFPVLAALFGQLGATSALTLLIGLGAIGALVYARSGLKPRLVARGWSSRAADIAARSAPVAVIAATTIVTWLFSLDRFGVAIVGTIPQGLPPLTLPSLDPALWRQLLVPAVLISVVGFVESVSVAQTLAAKRRQRIMPDQELIALGASNIASAVSSGFPVTGGFARSVVNHDAGAETPAAGAFTAAGILIAAILLTPLLYFLPKATLAATIIVAVLSLVDLGAIKRTFDYSRQDFAAMLATIAATLSVGVETGIVTGVAASIGLHLWRTSRPHCAIVGRVPGTEHYRNVERHAVETCQTVLTLRVDESLYFPNARFLEDKVAELVAERPALQHFVLMCTAVNHIDASALESLEAINRNLRDGGITFHLSEVKGPVMDQLKRSHFINDLTGRVFLSQYEAMAALSPETARACPV